MIGNGPSQGYKPQPYQGTIKRCACGTRYKVVDCRENNIYIRRRRRCIPCNSNITTYEISFNDLDALIGMAKRLTEIKETLINSTESIPKNLTRITKEFKWTRLGVNKGD